MLSKPCVRDKAADYAVIYFWTFRLKHFHVKVLPIDRRYCKYRKPDNHRHYKCTANKNIATVFSYLV